MKKLILSFLILTVSLPLAALQPDKNRSRHQVRIGWGDMLFETMAFHGSPAHIYPHPEQLPADFSIDESFDYLYTGHFFAGYQYRCTRSMYVGVMMDMEGIFWKEGVFNARHQQVVPATLVRNYNLVLMPTLRFDFMRTRITTLYAGLGAGALMAFDNAARVEFAPAVNLNVLGIQLGYGHWSGSIELGAMLSLSSPHIIYMLGSRLLSFSLNYSW